MAERCPVHASGRHDYNTDGFCGCNAHRGEAAREATPPAPEPKQWRCFHCDEVCADEAYAAVVRPAREAYDAVVDPAQEAYVAHLSSITGYLAEPSRRRAGSA